MDITIIISKLTIKIREYIFLVYKKERTIDLTVNSSHALSSFPKKEFKPKGTFYKMVSCQYSLILMVNLLIIIPHLGRKKIGLLLFFLFLQFDHLNILLRIFFPFSFNI